MILLLLVSSASPVTVINTIWKKLTGYSVLPDSAIHSYKNKLSALRWRSSTSDKLICNHLTRDNPNTPGRARQPRPPPPSCIDHLQKTCLCTFSAHFCSQCRLGLVLEAIKPERKAILGAAFLQWVCGFFPFFFCAFFLSIKWIASPSLNISETTGIFATFFFFNPVIGAASISWGARCPGSPCSEAGKCLQFHHLAF